MDLDRDLHWTGLRRHWGGLDTDKETD
uniref:Uncharacterized protein n=1 Tax=Anguilla anguilla TaxID=7936 RepID=A0A0E9TTS4_ANGAN